MPANNLLVVMTKIVGKGASGRTSFIACSSRPVRDTPRNGSQGRAAATAPRSVRYRRRALRATSNGARPRSQGSRPATTSRTRLSSVEKPVPRTLPSWRIQRGHGSGLARSHSRAVSSQDHVSTRVSSSEKAALTTVLRGARTAAALSGWAGSHNRAVPSSDHVNTRLSSLEKVAPPLASSSWRMTARSLSGLAVPQPHGVVHRPCQYRGFRLRENVVLFTHPRGGATTRARSGLAGSHSRAMLSPDHVSTRLSSLEKAAPPTPNWVAHNGEGAIGFGRIPQPRQLSCDHVSTLSFSFLEKAAPRTKRLWRKTRKGAVRVGGIPYPSIAAPRRC